MEGISCFNGGGGCFSDGGASFLSRGIGFGGGGGVSKKIVRWEGKI